MREVGRRRLAQRGLEREARVARRVGEHLDLVSDELRWEYAEQEERAGLEDPDLRRARSPTEEIVAVSRGGDSQWQMGVMWFARLA